MLDLATISTRLAQYPGLSSSLSLTTLVRFIVHSSALKESILLTQPASHDPLRIPGYLSTTTKEYLALVCDITVEQVEQCWAIFREVAWNVDEVNGWFDGNEALFLHHGLPRGITSNLLYPPSPFCSTSGCQHNIRRIPLKKPEPRQVVLLTFAKGALPAFSVHLYCRGCKTNYHNNFSMQNGERTYYSGMPDFVQVAEHYFVERKVIEVWISLMLTSWTSATNCANFYNSTLSDVGTQPKNWPFKLEVDTNNVWDAFTILCLLEDCHERTEILRVPHTGSQKDHFKTAVQARNARIRAFGFPNVLHRCNSCTRYFDRRAEGKGISKCSVVVIDGLTIGHPCCGVHNCHVPLANNRHRFCPIHDDQHRVCAIIGCSGPTEEGSRVCSDTAHQAIAARHHERGQARFKLRERLQRAQMLTGTNSGEGFTPVDAGLDVESEVEEFVVDKEGRVLMEEAIEECPDKLDGGNQKLRARFGRRRTHNEQIIVSPCGWINNRSTFYGSEAFSSVVEMIKNTYKDGPYPEHIFFDSNCRIAPMVRNDPVFKNIGLTVDVFHFTCKHKITDVFCQTTCNPWAYPELRTDEGGWYFNSSIAEQTNVWLGGYHAILREMLVDRYNFFLDEMIMRRNQNTLAKLEKAGKLPGSWLIPM